MEYNEYIIDFDRVNELSVGVKLNGYTNTNSNSDGSVNISYSVSRKIIKEYLEIYTRLIDGHGRNIKEEKKEFIIRTLKYNKILIDKSQIRDMEIDKILT